MEDKIKRLLKEKNIFHHENAGILVCNTDVSSGYTIAKHILYTILTPKSALYLSGGRTPKDFYALLAKEEVLHPGIVGLVDERFGPKFHGNSNEKMLQDSGLLRYLQIVDVPFYSILSDYSSRHSGKRSASRISLVSSDERSWTSQDDDGQRIHTAQIYDEKLRELIARYQKHVAILGVGLDGHTAGIIGNSKGFVNPIFSSERRDMLVSEFEAPHEKFKERITMTFLGLSMMDFLLLLVFGEDKKPAFELMFSDGSEDEVPSRFYKRPDIAKKTLAITDLEL